MRKTVWAALFLFLMATGGGLVHARSFVTHKAAYICPITGEVLPCPECCPFYQK
jgi:hypothetical protein